MHEKEINRLYAAFYAESVSNIEKEIFSNFSLYTDKKPKTTGFKFFEKADLEEHFVSAYKHKEPKYMSFSRDYDIENIEEIEEGEIADVAKFLCAQRDILNVHLAKKLEKTVVTEFKSEIFLFDIEKMPASIRKAKEENVLAGFYDDGIALSYSSLDSYLHLNPLKAAQILCAEVVRKLVSTGAHPISFVLDLNFGNIEDREVCWQWDGFVKGILKFSESFGLPLRAVNLSFNSLNAEENLYPSAKIAVLGGVNKKRCLSTCFEKKGDTIYLLGLSQNDIAASNYYLKYLEEENSPIPYFNEKEEKKIHQAILGLINEKVVSSAHIVSKGGLLLGLLEASMLNKLGFEILLDEEFRKDAYLFGEAQGRLIVSIDQNVEVEFMDFVIDNRIPVVCIGHVTGGKIVIDELGVDKILDYEQFYLTTNY